MARVAVRRRGEPQPAEHGEQVRQGLRRRGAPVPGQVRARDVGQAADQRREQRAPAAVDVSDDEPVYRSLGSAAAAAGGGGGVNSRSG